MVAATIQRAMVTVRNSKGLHMRPLELIARKAQSFRCQVFVTRGTNRVDAKSLLHLLTLGAEPGMELEIDATGDDACEAVEQLVTLIGSEFEGFEHS
jgi:phosphotransferase system HPr (HPr) family protein